MIEKTLTAFPNTPNFFPRPRKTWLIVGSERGGDRAAFMYPLIITTKINDIAPQAWLTDLFAKLPTQRFQSCRTFCCGTGCHLGANSLQERGLSRILPYNERRSRASAQTGE